MNQESRAGKGTIKNPVESRIMNQESRAGKGTIKNPVESRIMNQESRAGSGPIKNFTDLVVWQKGHGLVLEVYKVTGTFPKEEVYGLVSQMRRCAVSITSNIAEGFSRRGYREKTQFFSISAGSLTELENQLYIARDVDLISSEKAAELLDRVNEVQRILHALIKKTKQFVHTLDS